MSVFLTMVVLRLPIKTLEFRERGSFLLVTLLVWSLPVILLQLPSWDTDRGRRGGHSFRGFGVSLTPDKPAKHYGTPKSTISNQQIRHYEINGPIVNCINDNCPIIYGKKQVILSFSSSYYRPTN